MLRLSLAAMVAGALVASTGCRTSLEDDETSNSERACMVTTTQACMDAEMHDDLAWIEANVFVPSCAFSGCHNGTATAAGRLDLKTPGASHAALVNVASAIDASRMLVVPGAPKDSYLLMIMQHYKPSEMMPPMSAPPEDIGYMPQNGGGALCCQKLDALERWIAAGAMNN